MADAGLPEARRGTGRAGRCRRVSPLGLASCLSKSVKAWMSSLASKVRLRLPTVDCERMFAATIRATAPFAAGTLRPIRAAAPCTVQIGSSRQRVDKEIERRIPAHAAQSKPPALLDSGHALLKHAGVGDRAPARRAKTATQRFTPSWASPDSAGPR